MLYHLILVIIMCRRTQNHLVFQPMRRFFKRIENTDHVSEWKSNGLFDEIIKPPSASNNSLTQALSYFGTKTKINLNGNGLKQDKITYIFITIGNIYIVYELSSNLNRNESITLENCFIGAVKLNKNADIK